MTAVRVIVTRPAREAAQWVDELRAAGLDAVALPLIAIAAIDDAAPVRAAWRRLGDFAALMFVSAAAVEQFFGHGDAFEPELAAPADRAAIAAHAGLRFWATGPGTARALERAGVQRAAIDMPPPEAARFDSEALWAVVRGQVRPGLRVLVVRGGDAAGRPAGRDWLMNEIAASGGLPEAVVAYRRVAPPFGEAERRLAAEGAAGEAVWLFSSSEAIANLRQALPGTHWKAAGAVATHPRIAEAATAAGFGRVRLAPPLPAALVASIESFR